MSVDAGVRLQRVLRAMPIIAGREEVAVDDMPAVAGVDALTLLEDLRALTEREDEPGGFVEAVSVFFDGNTFSVSTPHFRRPTRITLPELCALELGLAILGGSSTQAERSVVDRARARVRKAIVALPESAGRDDLWYSSGPSIPDEETLTSLRSCAAEKTKAEIVYQKGDSAESTTRVIHPYGVVPVRGKWFVIAHCERADGIRFFRVDRVRSATCLTAPFDLPAGVENLLVGGDGRAFGSSPSERLVVRYSPSISRWIAEREEGEKGADGSYTVSHPLADDAWAVRHVLQYGPEAEVLEPTRIRELIASKLRSILGR